MRAKLLAVVLLLLCATQAVADIACDGVDDDLLSGFPISTFFSASTGTLMLWHKPTGLPENNGTPDCYAGGLIAAAYELGVGTWLSLTRNADYGGLDRLTAFHWDGTANCTAAAYTANAWTHLAWVHGSGTLAFYKDGVLAESTPAGDTFSLAGHLHICVGAAFVSQEIVVSEGVVVGVEVFPTALVAQEIAAKASARLHHIGVSVRTGAWRLDDCATTGNGVAFFDHSGNSRPLTGDNGPDNTGLTCQANSVLTYPWGPD